MPTAATGRRLQQASPGNGFTYILNTTTVSQAEASGTCNGIGGQLVAFKNLAEQVGPACRKSGTGQHPCIARTCWAASL